MRGTLIAVLLLASMADAKRYSYKNCIQATKLWCRHQKYPGHNQVDCVGLNAQQCADCLTYTALGHITRADDPMGVCKEWLDGTFIRALRHPRIIKKVKGGDQQ